MKFLWCLRDRQRSYERDLAKACQRGAKRHGDQVKIIPQPEYYAHIAENHDGLILFGVAGPNDRLYRTARNVGKHTVFIDKGYFQRGSHWRLAANAYQPDLTQCNYPSDRFDQLNITIPKPSIKGKHILYAGSSEKNHRFHRLPHPEEYARNVFKEVQRWSNKPIHYRHKPSWRYGKPIESTVYCDPNKIIEHDLRKAYCLVTNNSGSDIKAWMKGVPVVTLGEAVTRPISASNISDSIIANYDLPLPSLGQIYSLFHNIAYHEYSTLEFATGLAWDVVYKILHQ